MKVLDTTLSFLVAQPPQDLGHLHHVEPLFKLI